MNTVLTVAKGVVVVTARLVLAVALAKAATSALISVRDALKKDGSSN